MKQLLSVNKFFSCMWQEKSSYHDDPLSFAVSIMTETNTVLGRTLNMFIQNDVPDISFVMQQVTKDIRNCESSRRMTYRDVNSSLLYTMYTRIEKKLTNEHYRIAFTQFRVNGRSLDCEARKRKSRVRGRLTIENPLCTFSDIQTERHVAQYCPITQHIRYRHNFDTIDDQFSKQFSAEVRRKMSFYILCTFKQCCN